DNVEATISFTATVPGLVVLEASVGTVIATDVVRVAGPIRILPSAVELTPSQTYVLVALSEYGTVAECEMFGGGDSNDSDEISAGARVITLTTGTMPASGQLWCSDAYGQSATASLVVP